MKKYILYLLLSPQFVFSQTTLTGTVKDEKRNPVPFTNVFVKPDKSEEIIGYCQSDEKGAYKLKLNKTGKLLLNFSAMSYKTVVLPVEFTRIEAEIIKNVIMIYEPIELNEVIVLADKYMIIKKDTIVFNAKAYAKGGERVVEDLLKNIPGLSVSSDGTIKLGNKDIEKIMIDGDDFFEKGYRMLSKNMPAYPIDKIEVYQHYSNNKLLKGIENSEKVALNLKLDEKSKRQWFGNISLGFDPVNEKHEVFGNLMNFGKKTKFYGITSMNNLGEDAVGDINFLIRPSEQSESGPTVENQNSHMLINISPFSPALKLKRILFNNSKVFSLNSIFTITPSVKMKVLAFLNADENNYYMYNFESTSVGETTFTNTEGHQLGKRILLGFGKLDLTKDISKTQSLIFTGKYNHSNEKDGNKLLFNDSITNEKLETTNLLADQRLVYTNRFNKNKVLIFTGKYIYEKYPQYYSLDRFYYQELFPEDKGVDEVNQNINNKMQFAALEAHLMDKKNNGNLLEIKFGNQFRSDNLSSNFSLLTDDKVINEPIGYQNETSFTTNNIYLTTKYRLGIKHVDLISTLEFHQIYNRIVRPGFDKRQNPFFINPLFGMEWHINDRNKILTTYSYNHTSATVLEEYDQFVHTGFRTFSKGSDNFKQLNQSSAILNYNYGGWGEKSFAYILISYNKLYDYFSTNSVVKQNYTQSEKIIIKGKQFLMFISNYDKYIKLISSTLKLSFGSTMSNYGNIVNGSEIRNISYRNFNYGFELRSGFNSIFNYHFGSKWTRSDVVTIAKNKYTDNLSFLDLSFVFSKKLVVLLEAERYFFGSLDKNNNKYYFLDAKIKYTVKENKLSFTLSGQNILNTKTFRSYSISDISVSKKEYRLQPRYTILMVEYRF